jgi:hypothetical protein
MALADACQEQAMLLTAPDRNTITYQVHLDLRNAALSRFELR